MNTHIGIDISYDYYYNGVCFITKPYRFRLVFALKVQVLIIILTQSRNTAKLCYYHKKTNTQSSITIFLFFGKAKI